MIPTLTAGLGPWWRRFVVLCIASTVYFLALHAIYSLPAIPLQYILAYLIGFAMFAELVMYFAFAMVAVALLLIVWVPLAPLALVSKRCRGWLGAPVAEGPERGLFRFHPWLYAIGWAGIAMGHLALDMDPPLILVGLTGLAILLPETWARLGRLWPPLVGRRAWVLVVLLGLFWLTQASDGARFVAVIVWMGWLAFLTRWLARRWVQRDRFLLGVYALCGVQMLSVLLPGMSVPEGAQELGEGMAYSFVECQGRMFAAVPRCSPEEKGIPTCRTDSTVEEYAWSQGRRKYVPVASHRFFSDDYAGRIEQLECMGDRVSVGMDWTIHDGVTYRQNNLEFDPTDPSKFRVNPLGDSSGDGITYDAKRRLAYYTSHADVLVQRNLDTDERNRELGVNVGLPDLIDVKVAADRDVLMALGLYAQMIELDGETLAFRANHTVLNAWEMSIDEELDRVYAGGNWGVEVIEIGTGKLIGRMRVGLGGRRVAIDHCNQMLYVATTAGGRIHAYDRITLKHLGDLPVGPGSRYPYVTESGDHVLFTTNSHHYAIDARQLARRMRGGDSPHRRGRDCGVEWSGRSESADQPDPSEPSDPSDASDPSSE